MTRSSASTSLNDAIDVATVLAFRLPMLMMTPNATRQREAERMIAEKMQAAWDGTLAWQAYWMEAGLMMWSNPPSAESFADAYEAWVAPGRRTLRANARRLSARKRI